MALRIWRHYMRRKTGPKSPLLREGIYLARAKGGGLICQFIR
jgi:hypothetical protein